MIMAKGPCRRGRAVALCVAALCIPFGWSGAGAAPIIWGKQGRFEACLESKLEKWLQAQAELLVNEDAAASRLDDAAVAKWTVDTLALCRSRAGQADASSEDRFANHMARWRNHIYDVASSIRQKGVSD
jgi:hypothetical protein